MTNQQSKIVAPRITPDSKILLITMNHSNAGFFAQVTFALNQIRYCEDHGYLPVVWYGEDSLDGPNAFYDPSVGENVWDYYFEPVAGYTYADIVKKLNDPGDPLSADQVAQLSSDELWHIHEKDPDSIFNYPYGCFRDGPADERWYESQRQKARDIVDRYIRVKPEILDEVDAFFEAHMSGQPVLGLHLRGTDKGTADSSPRLMRIVPPAEYFPLIDDYIGSQPSAKVFVATDQSQYVDEIRSRYGERVVSCDVMRAQGDINVFQMEGANYRKGREVLVDALLLSRCDFLLKCTSAVGEFAMYFNRNLKCRDLNQESTELSWLGQLRVKYGIKRRRKRVSELQEKGRPTVGGA